MISPGRAHGEPDAIATPQCVAIEVGDDEALPRASRCAIRRNGAAAIRFSCQVVSAVERAKSHHCFGGGQCLPDSTRVGCIRMLGAGGAAAAQISGAGAASGRALLYIPAHYLRHRRAATALCWKHRRVMRRDAAFKSSSQRSGERSVTRPWHMKCFSRCSWQIWLAHG